MPRKPVTPASDRPLSSDEHARERRDMKVVQRIADGLAHELNNVLTAIIGRASVLLSELEVASAGYRDVEAILAASRSGLNLTKNLLSFSGAPQAEPEPLALNDLIHRVTALWDHSEPKIDIELALAADLRRVMGDASQLRRMLVHLGLNAIEAMPEGGTLTFTTRNVTLEAGRPSDALAELAPGDYARLQVSDSGTGMDAEVLRQAFEPFFTTKSPAVAAGLGLPFVANTVKNHGGYVELFSKKGLGTTVTIWLPALAEQVNTAAAPPARSPRPTTAEVVLVVDDDPLVLGTSVRLLSKLGYSVVTAVDGEDALASYGSRRGRFAVVLADLIMPGMDGIQLTSRLIAADPQVRVVLCSATPDEDAERRCLASGAVYFLAKPYTLQQLQAAITAARRPG